MNHKLNNLTLAFLMMVVGNFAGTIFASSCQIRLRPAVEVGRGPVCLSDIAEVAVSDAEMKHRLETMVIYDVPSDINEAKLGVFEISRVLSGAGINPVSVDIYGASFCRVAVKADAAGDPGPESQQNQVIVDVSETPPAEAKVLYTLTHALTEAVVRSTSYEASRLIIDWDCRDRQMLTEPADGNRFTIIPASTITLGTVRFDVIDNNSSSGDKAGGAASTKPSRNRVQVEGNVQYLCDSVFSLRPLRPGQVITKDDVKLVSHTVTDVSDCGIGDINAVVGQEVALSVRSSQMLLPSMIKKITLIKRNDLVDVSSMAGKVSINMTGRALSDGAYGDIISVRDERNKTVLRGTVTGAGMVTVMPAAAPAEATTKTDDGLACSEISATGQAVCVQNQMAGIK